MMKIVVLRDGSFYEVPMTAEEAARERERVRVKASHDEAQALWNARCKGARSVSEERAIADSKKYGISIGESVVDDSMQAYKAAHAMRKDEIAAANEVYYESVNLLLTVKEADMDAEIERLRARLNKN